MMGDNKIPPSHKEMILDKEDRQAFIGAYTEPHEATPAMKRAVDALGEFFDGAMKNKPPVEEEDELEFYDNDENDKAT